MDFIHHLPKPTLLLREDSTILQANQIASDLLKLEIFDLMGRRISSFLNDGNKAVFHDIFNRLPDNQVRKWTTDLRCGDNTSKNITLFLSRLPGHTVIIQLHEEWTEQNLQTIPDSSIKLLEAQYQHAHAGLIMIGQNREVIYANEELNRLWNIPELGSQSPDLKQSLAPVIDKVKAPEKFLEKINRYCEPSDIATSDEIALKDERFLLQHSYPIYNDNLYLARLWHFIDITEFKKANQLINRQQKFLQAVLENIQDGIVACDTDYRLTFFNQAGRKLHGLNDYTFTSEKWTEKYQLYKEDGLTPTPREKHPLFRVLQGETVYNEEMVIKTMESGESRNLRASGKAIYDDSDHKLGAVISFHDITDLKTAQQKLQHMAYHDALTGLPNRRLFHILLEQAVSQARRNQEKVGVCFFDLDNFKSVNDSLGHDAGDKMLIKVTKIVRDCLRASDMICRWGGDEFVLALPQISHIEDASYIAGKICGAIEQEIARIYPDFSITTSMGVALYPDHASHPDNLIRSADIAMYLAKQKGKNRFCFIAPEFIPEEKT